MELSQDLRLYLIALALRGTPALAVVLFESQLFVQPLALQEWILYISSWNFKKTSWSFRGDFFLWRYPSSRKHVNLLDLSWWEVTSKSVKSSLFIRKTNESLPTCMYRETKPKWLSRHFHWCIELIGWSWLRILFANFGECEKCHIISETFIQKSVMVGG